MEVNLELMKLIICFSFFHSRTMYFLQGKTTLLLLFLGNSLYFYARKYSTILFILKKCTHCKKGFVGVANGRLCQHTHIKKLVSEIVQVAKKERGSIHHSHNGKSNVFFVLRWF